MKKTLLFLLMTLTGLSMMAKPVEPEKVVQVAKNFMAQYVKGADKMEATVVYTHTMPKSGQPAMYAVNIGNMFVLVSADDIAHPVLGYSLSRPWPVINDERGMMNDEQPSVSKHSTFNTHHSTLPPQVASYLDDLATQIEAASAEFSTLNSQFSIEETSAEWQQLLSLNSHLLTTTNLPDSVGPLLTTTWDQGQYYNVLCPEDASGPAGHVYTGCVATAMAQIINYWGYPIHGRGTHSYTSNYGTLSVNYDSATYDYTHMSNALTATSTPQEVNAVATLMRDCGVAANMGYGPSESGAYDIDARAGLINFFRLSPDLSYAEKAFFADSVWGDMLRTDISANRPVMYSGHGDNGGHTFVCDGYKQDNYFHFNFGWGGYADGWYLTSAVNPATMAFNSDQSAILSIAPDSTGNVILGQMTGASTFTVDEPLEFYHLLGHNTYTGTSYNNACNNTVNFISSNSANQLVADIIEFEDQNLTINSGRETRSLCGGCENNLSPVVSSSNAINITYSGSLYYAGFHIIISRDEGCRRVSNIVTSIDTTTVHLMWTENGTATQWQIEYGEEGFAHGDGTIILVNNTTTDITFPLRLTKYDIYIRSVCGNNIYGSWSKLPIQTGAPYWQDIVVSQPASYSVDETTHCAIITCAEDFVWYLKNNDGYNARLIADIDLNGYKWKPVEYSVNQEIDGYGHKIKHLYVNEPYDFAALFSSFYSQGTIKNLGIENSTIYGTGYGVSGFCGDFYGVVENCYISNSTINGRDMVGGFVARNFGTITNCYSNVEIFGTRWVGMLAGYSDGTFDNCYAAGTIHMRSNCYYAGISAYAAYGSIHNCYSVDLPMGVVGYKGETIITDTSSFYSSGNVQTLRTPIVFESTVENNLLGALNNWVIQRNDSTIKTWAIDTGNTNAMLPVYGDYYVVQCPNVSNLAIQNIKKNSVSAVVVNWEESDSAAAYEIKYQPVNTSNDSAIIVLATSKPDTLYGLSLGREYTISVRHYCNENSHSGWTSKREMIDLPFWTDIVATQPEGYVEDSEGNVTISSVEGLAWLSAVVNGLHGNAAQTFEGKTISLISNLDLQGYRWFPIGRGWYSGSQYSSCFNGVFRGNNHTISNMYVNSYGPHLGLFGYSGYGSMGTTISDVILDNGSVNCYFNDNSDGGFGGLVGTGVGLKEITNCNSNIVVSGNRSSGSLCGWLYDDDNNPTIVSNCSATGDVFGREASGGLIGEARGVFVRNCYATGDVLLNESGSNAWYRGGLIGNLMSNATVRNCYSIGTVEMGEGRVIGCPYMNSNTHYVYGLNNSDLPLIGPSTDEITDTSSFVILNNQQILLSPVVIQDSTYNNLLDALNAWVNLSNSPTLNTWIIDTANNGGFPIFGDNYNPSCYNPTNVTAANATQIGDTTISTQISWEQQGEPISWEIMYVYPQQSMDSGTTITVNSNPCILTELPVGALLDIYVRAVCDSNEKSGWSESVKYIPDKLHWTEIVTSQPDGYQEDQYSNVYISSAEGLSWLASRKNKLNGNTEDFYPQSVTLMSDIDLSAYRWTAIDNMGCVFEGNNHIIRGLYCNENESYQGLFSQIYSSCTIQNVILLESSVHGLIYNGIISGYTWGSIINCIVNGEIFGLQYTGGLCGISYGSVINSAFVGELNARTDVSLANQFNGFYGGIVGNTAPGCQIINTYAVSEIPEYDFSGIIAGSGQGEYRNIFALYYPTGLNLTYDNTESNSSFFTGSGNVWTLSNPLFIGGEFHSNLIDALNAWVDAYDTAGIYRHWATDSANVNNGFPVFATIPCTPATGNDSITVCDSYSWHGTVYTADAVLTDTLSTIDGCDSIVSHHLFVHHSTTGDTTATACDSFSWYEHIDLTESADTLTHTFTGANIQGCDSIVTLHLTINYSSTGDTTATACDNFTWWNTNYTSSTNTPIHVYTNAAGCDSTVTLHLTINHSTSSILTDTACEAYFWDGEWRYVSGQYTDTTINAAGCDSIATLNLTINNPVHTATTVTACDSYTWQEAVITTSGTYHYTHTDAHGCTQDDTLYLTINHNDTVIVDEEVCDSLTWYGTTYTASAYGIQYLTVPNTVGCDSIFFLDLTVNYTTYGEMSAVSCDSYQWDWNGAVYTTSGDYTYRDTVNMNSQFCDSVLTLHLTVNYSATSDTTATACDLFVWYGHMGYDVSGNYEHRWWNVTTDGCDSILTLHLTINHSAETTVTDTAEGSYTWNGTTYTESGTYTWTGETVEGCDSSVTLILTINQVGIFDIQNSEFKINIFPNPTTDLLTIDADDIFSVELFDLNGRRIFSSEVDSSPFTIHLSPFTLSAGSYLLRIHTRQGTAVQHVILK